MKVQLTRKAVFSAAHRLYSPHLSEEENQDIYRKCGNPHGHGHTYRLEVTIEGEIDPRTGMLMNLEDLDQVIETEIISKVDHQHLNYDVPFLHDVIPTIENLVVVFWSLLESKFPPGALRKVVLWETDKSYVTYFGPSSL